MRIPFSALETRSPGAGEKIRINLFRSQGPMPNQTEVVWRPTMSATFHLPERFGQLRRVEATAQRRLRGRKINRRFDAAERLHPRPAPLQEYGLRKAAA